MNAQKKYKEAQKNLAIAAEALHEHNRRRLIVCETNCRGKGCGRRTRVSNLVWLQTRWWVPPRGCTEGGYWRESEGHFQCPKCGHINREYSHPSEFGKLRRYFLDEASVTKEELERREGNL